MKAQKHKYQDLNFKKWSLLVPIFLYSCGPNPASEVKAENTSNKSIFVKIGPELEENTYNLYFSAPQQSASLSFCKGAEKCTDPVATNFLANLKNHKVYVSTQPIKLEDKASMRFESENADGTTEYIVTKFIKKSADTSDGDDTDQSIDPNQGDYKWENDINFVDVAQTRFSGNTYNSEFYKDVMTHVANPYLQDSALTIVHESLHFLLHEQDGKTAASDKFVYYKNGKGTYYPEPKLRTADLNQSLPSEIKAMGKLYNTYIRSRSTSAENQVIGENIVDEWQAYIAENISLIEATQSGTSIRNDSVEGAAAEFLYYNAGVMMLLNKQEPEHLEKKNVKAIFAMLAEKTKWIFDNKQATGKLSTTHAQEIFDHLRTNKNSQDIRTALIKIYGPVWTKRILGF